MGGCIPLIFKLVPAKGPIPGTCPWPNCTELGACAPPIPTLVGTGAAVGLVGAGRVPGAGAPAGLTPGVAGVPAGLVPDAGAPVGLAPGVVGAGAGVPAADGLGAGGPC